MLGPNTIEEAMIDHTEKDLLEKFKTCRTDAISEMFDNPDSVGIYPTGKFFDTIDKFFLQALSQARAEEREKVAQWMRLRGFATGHGDTIEDLLGEAGWQRDEIRQKEREKLQCITCDNRNPKYCIKCCSTIKEEAIEDLIEACAKVADDDFKWSNDFKHCCGKDYVKGYKDSASGIAQAIRDNGKT